MQGADFNNTLTQILRALHRITVLQLTQATSKTKCLNDLAAQWSPEEVQLYYEITLRGQQDINISPSQHLGFEMTLLRLIAFTPNQMQEKRPQARKHIQPQQQKPKPVTNSAAKGNKSDYWVDLLSKITLTGATNALAQSCALQSCAENEIILMLDPSHEALLSQKHIDRIQLAIEKTLKRKMTVSIRVGKSSEPSAQATTEKKKQQRMNKIEHNLRNDSNVKNILSTFDATIITETINEKLEEVK